jgi:hypothetical protein
MQFFALFLALLALVVVVAQAQTAPPIQYALSVEGYYNSSARAPYYSFVLKGNSQTVTTLVEPNTDAVSYSVQSIIGAQVEVRLNEFNYTWRGSSGAITFGTHQSPRAHTPLLLLRL